MFNVCTDECSIRNGNDNDNGNGTGNGGSVRHRQTSKQAGRRMCSHTHTRTYYLLKCILITRKISPCKRFPLYFFRHFLRHSLCPLLDLLLLLLSISFMSLTIKISAFNVLCHALFSCVYFQFQYIFSLSLSLPLSRSIIQMNISTAGPLARYRISFTFLAEKSYAHGVVTGQTHKLFNSLFTN